MTQPQQIKSAVDKVVASGVDVVFSNVGHGLAGPLEGLADMMGAIRTTRALS
jgi:hypothetical protein